MYIYMVAVFAQDLKHHAILLRRNAVLRLYKRLSPCVGGLENSINYQGMTGLLYPLTEAKYTGEVEHACSVCHLQLSSGVCDVICDAGTWSLWSLESH